MLLNERPAQYWRVRGNYGSYVEHKEKGAEGLLRLRKRGVREGPLHYRPWVVNPMGGVWQPEKEKWRTIFDLTASGVNDCLLLLECKYDTLDVMLPEQTTDAWQFGWDLKDAFFNTGRWAEPTRITWACRTRRRVSSTGTGLRCLGGQTVRLISSGSPRC